MGYSDEVLADSPALYLGFEETSGATCADSSTNALTGTAHGTFTRNVSTGFAGVGLGITLGGSTSDYVDLSKVAALNITGDVTYECWMKATSFSGAGNVLICAGATGSGAQGYQLYVFDSGGSGDIRLTNTWTNSTIIAVGSGTLSTGTWYHVVATYVSGGGGAAKIYVNGSQVASGTSSVAATTNTEPFTVGVQSINGTRSAPFVGTIADVAIYPSALSSTRVSDHYNARNSTSGISVPYIASATTVYAPTAGLVGVNPSFISSVTSAYAPSLSVSGAAALTVPAISSHTSLYALTLGHANQDINLPFISSHTTVYAPASLRRSGVGAQPVGVSIALNDTALEPRPTWTRLDA